MFFEILFMIYVLSNILESCMLGLILVRINLVRNLNLQLSIYPTIHVHVNIFYGTSPILALHWTFFLSDPEMKRA